MFYGKCYSVDITLMKHSFEIICQCHINKDAKIQEALIKKVNLN